MSANASDKYPNYSPGLEGVIAGVSKISEIDSDRSSLQYRGYDVHDLAEQGCYEETAYLLLKNKLPNAAELAEFKATLAAERQVPNYIYDILKAMPKNTHPMDLVRTAYSALAPSDPDYTAPSTDREANVRKAVRIVAKASTLVGKWSPNPRRTRTPNTQGRAQHRRKLPLSLQRSRPRSKDYSGHGCVPHPLR